MAEYRQGNFSAAIKLLQPDFPSALQASAKLVLAMAQYRDGQTDLARRTFTAIDQQTDWAPTKSFTRRQWMAQVLRREALQSVPQ